MSILWCGGEDIDFSNGVLAQVTLAARFRTTYAREAVQANGTTGNMVKSSVFPGGAVTNCWLSYQAFNGTATLNTGLGLIGLGASGTNKGLFMGVDSVDARKMNLMTYDGTNWTVLATEAGESIANSIVTKFDMQLANYGASATVNVYANGILIITFSGDARVTGVAGFDSVFLNGQGTSAVWSVSEVIVANEDTRSFPGLMTMALTGAGTTDDWTGTFSNINGTTISDANPAFTNTAAKDEQFNITDLPSGTFVIKAVKIAARAAHSTGSTATKVQLGYNNGGVINFGAAAVSLTTGYATWEQLDLTDPTTSSAWTQAEMNALQLDMRSA